MKKREIIWKVYLHEVYFKRDVYIIDMTNYESDDISKT